MGVLKVRETNEDDIKQYESTRKRTSSKERKEVLDNFLATGKKSVTVEVEGGKHPERAFKQTIEKLLNTNEYEIYKVKVKSKDNTGIVLMEKL